MNSPKGMIFSLLFVLSGIALGGQARAYSEALIALQFSDGHLYHRVARIETILNKGYRFDRVRVVINADENELATLVRNFAARPAMPAERRFIWVSATVARRADDTCPEHTSRQVKPRAALMMIAPACFRNLIAVPAGIRHSEFAPSWIDSDRKPRPVNPPLSADYFAFIGLPDDHPVLVEAADRAITRRLVEGWGGLLSAYVIFETLRNRLTTDGSDFTPYLEVSRPKAAWATNLFGGNLAGPAIDRALPAPSNIIAPQRRNTSRRFRLYRAPDITANAVTVFEAGNPVTVLRDDVSGAMAYIETEGGYYGWVDKDELR